MNHWHRHLARITAAAIVAKTAVETIVILYLWE